MTIVLRADGSPSIGLGHVYRLLALCEILNEKFEVVFATRSRYESILEEVVRYGARVVVIPETLSPREETEFLSTQLDGTQVVVLDGYNFDTAYQQAVKPYTRALVCIDDIYQYHFVADAIVNHSAGITADLYSAESFSKFYLGFDFVVLRKPFLDLAKSHKDFTTSNHVFISLGGADKNNDVVNVLKICMEKEPSSTFHVVLGSAYSHWAEFHRWLQGTTQRVQVYNNIGAEHMAALMSTCSRGICSPSTVCLEYLCTGGELFLYQIAENQSGPYKSFVSNNIAKPIEMFGHSSGDQTLRKFIDGRSGERFIKIFSNLFASNGEN